MCLRHEVEETSVWIALLNIVTILFVSHVISMKSHVTSIRLGHIQTGDATNS